MQLTEGKQRFIDSWGQLGSNWGSNKTMGQIHALLLVSTEPLCCDDIMEELQLSRGNVNTNVRTLLDWGLVQKTYIPGDRKDFYEAEKDVFAIFKAVIRERKKRELDPMLKVLASIKEVDGQCDQSKEFTRMVTELHSVSNQANKALETILDSDNNWIFNPMMRLMR